MTGWIVWLATMSYMTTVILWPGPGRRRYLLVLSLAWAAALAVIAWLVPLRSSC